MFFVKFSCLIALVCTCFTQLNANVENHIIELNENNWQLTLQDEWMVEFYAPWCPACKSLQETWKSFANWGVQMGVKVAQVDVTSSPGLSGRFMVTALPTIFHVSDGVFRQYRGSRDKESFYAFITEKKWLKVEAVPFWKAPDSLQMTVLSMFFKLSQTLRVVHTKLMDDFGLPTWGSYLIFALATIVIGAILGLILVCLLDIFYPPKTFVPAKQKKNTTKHKKDELSDEEINDDLVDDVGSADDKDVDEQDGEEKDNDDEKEEIEDENEEKEKVSTKSNITRKRKPRTE